MQRLAWNALIVNDRVLVHAAENAYSVGVGTVTTVGARFRRTNRLTLRIEQSVASRTLNSPHRQAVHSMEPQCVERCWRCRRLARLLAAISLFDGDDIARFPDHSAPRLDILSARWRI
jgi:hypothetical protein